MSILAWVLKFVVTIIIYNILLNSIFRKIFPANRYILTWRRGWGFEAAFMMTVLVSFYTTLIIVEAMDRLPGIGPLFATVSFGTELAQIDTQNLWLTLGGLLLTRGVVAAALALVYLPLVSKFWRLRPENLYGRLWLMISILLLINWGYLTLTQRLGLPDPTSVKFAVFYNAVAARVATLNLGDWRGPLISMGSTFALLGAIAIFFNLAWIVSQQGRSRSVHNRNIWFLRRGRRILRIFQVSIYLVGIWGAFQFAIWLFNSRLSTLQQIGNPLITGFLRQPELVAVTLLLVIIIGVAWLFWRLEGPADLFEALRLRWRSLAEIGLGVLWSILLILGVALVQHFFRWQQLDWFGWLGRTNLPGYILFALLDAVAIELLFRGFVLQKLTISFNLVASAIISSIYCSMYYISIPKLTWIGLLIIFLAAIFQCYLFRISRSLWLPITFHFSWNFFLGPVSAFPLDWLNTGGSPGVSLNRILAWVTARPLGQEAAIPTLITLLLALGTIGYLAWLEQTMESMA